MNLLQLVIVTLAISPLVACSGATPPPASGASNTSPASSASGSSGAAETPKAAPLGLVTRAELETLPKFVDAWAKGDAPSAEAAKALALVPPGATVRVFLGTWCSDSRRELVRFWKAVDLAGGKLPFAVELVAVDHDKTDPGGLSKGVGLRYVPTFVVLRAGKELGRVIESAPGGIEHDLGVLLRGEKTGVISGRSDVGA